MNSTDLQALRSELATVKAELAQLKTTLDTYFNSLPQEQFRAWREVKRAVMCGETPNDAAVVVGKNLPKAPTKHLSNGIGL